MIPSDREASAQVASILASARDAGLPTDPIIGKVNYGVNARRSRPDAIVRSASAVKTRLEAARVALAPNPTAPEIVEGEKALAENATAGSLRAVRQAGGNRSVASALGLLTQLLASGIELPEAEQRVTTLLRKGATPMQLVAFGNDVVSDVTIGYKLEDALNVRANHLIATLAAERGITTEFLDTPATTTNSGLKAGSATPPNPPPRRP